MATDCEDRLLDGLIRFFSEQEPVSGPEIRHPDPHVEEMARLSPDTFRKASVLIPVIKPSTAVSSQIILTVRSHDLSSHAGQVSFPVAPGKYMMPMIPKLL